jgi:hypothetical protein
MKTEVMKINKISTTLELQGGYFIDALRPGLSGTDDLRDIQYVKFARA